MTLARLLSVATVATLAVAGSPAARAATFTVNSVADTHDRMRGDGICVDSDGACTLRAAIEEANEFAGPDQIILPAGKYRLAVGSPLNITDHLAIDGIGIAETIIKGRLAGTATDIHVTDNIEVQLSNMALRGVKVINHGNLSLNRMMLSRNRVTVDNSLVVIYNFATVTMNDVSLINPKMINLYSIDASATAVLSNVSIVGGGLKRQGSRHPIIARDIEMTNVTIKGRRGSDLLIGPYGKLLNVTLDVALNGGLTANIEVQNSIFAAGCGGGNIISLGHNLYSGAPCGVSHITDLSNTDPLLGKLIDNGGPTATMALLPSSAAIDAIDDNTCPPTDQRGLPRPQGAGCDIGAYELQP